MSKKHTPSSNEDVLFYLINRTHKRSKQSQKLLKPLNSVDASQRIYVKQTSFPHKEVIFIPNRPYYKLKDGMELKNKRKKLPTNPSKENKEKNLERSLRRTRKVMSELSLCNAFDLFVTFTFDKAKIDRYDVQKCKNAMQYWIRNQYKRVGKFIYIIVAERHKDGACHFHALVGGYAGVLVETDVKKHGRTAYNLKSYRLGYSTAIKIDNPHRTASYIQKYIQKDMTPIAGKKRYWSSKGLKRAVVTYNPNPWYENQKPDWSHVSVNGTTLVFNKQQENA